MHLQALLLMITSTASLPAHPLCVQRIAREGAHPAPACVDAGGSVVAAHAAPGGGVVALVAGEDPERTVLLRWSGEPGSPPVRRALDVSGAVLSSRLRADGDLVIVTRQLVARVAPDGAVRARRAVAEKTYRGAAAPEGAWLLHDAALTWIPLDARAPSWTGAPPSPPGEGQVEGTSIHATTSGDAIVAARVSQHHPVKGTWQPDDVNTLALTRLDPAGGTLGSATIGEVRTHRQWLWAEWSTPRPVPYAGPFPSALGIVRTRWSGKVSVRAVGEAPGETLVVAVEHDDRAGGSGPPAPHVTLHAFDRELRPLWTTDLGDARIRAASPAWARGSLLEHRVYGEAARAGGHVVAVDERGRVAWTADYPDPFARTGTSDSAIGQAPDGGWYVVLW